ncbi:MAG: TM2 domain-containing protein, partial [Acidimicrobiales bacterium]|nr:TM2 domain-containing protein [Acidimicrobiales bacterium]
QDQPYQQQPYPGQPGQDQPYQQQPYPGQPGQDQPYQQQPYPGPAVYQAPQYGAVQYPAGGADPQAPYGRDPQTGLPYSEKSKIVAGLLQLFLGGFGVGRFYLGYSGIGVAQLLTCGGLGLWALIDAIMILTGSVKDSNGLPLRS